MKTLRPLNLSIAFVLVNFVFAINAMAGKVELSIGGYSFSASNSSNNTSSSFSGFGSYRIAYRTSILNSYEIDLGYSLLATDGIGGDLSFGFDLGLNYYPFTQSGSIMASAPGANAIFSSIWRPHIGASFNQRNFQSIGSQYAGFGIKAGLEYQMTDQFSLIGTMRYLILGGPNLSSASQLDFLFGTNFQF